MPRVGYKIHDFAMGGAAAILEIFKPALREEEQREAFNMTYEALKALLEKYEEEVDRINRRVRPSRN